MTENPLFRSDFRKFVEEEFAGGFLGDGVRGARLQCYDHGFNCFADTADVTADMEAARCLGSTQRAGYVPWVFVSAEVHELNHLSTCR